jgi:hypothetical protein
VLFSENSLDSSGPNMLLTTSYECNFSYSCPGGGDVSVRYLESPSVLGAPEPAGWALMLIGVGGIGMAVRRRSAMSRAAC